MSKTKEETPAKTRKTISQNPRYVIAKLETEQDRLLKKREKIEANYSDDMADVQTQLNKVAGEIFAAKELLPQPPITTV